jgi:hypothetical protein
MREVHARLLIDAKTVSAWQASIGKRATGAGHIEAPVGLVPKPLDW